MKHGTLSAGAPAPPFNIISPEEVALSRTLEWPPHHKLFPNAPSSQPNRVTRLHKGWIAANPVSVRGENG